MDTFRGVYRLEQRPVLSDSRRLPDQPAEVLARFDSQRSQIMSFGLLLWLMPPLAIAVVCRWVYRRIPAPA